MKSALIGALVALFLLSGIAAMQFGITPAWVIHGPGVAAGIGAKLLCSAEYVVGQDREQAYTDVVQYSPILEQLSVDYDESGRGVTATFLGITERTATYLPGVGCAIDFRGVDTRYGIKTSELEASEAPWPAGGLVATIDPELQALTDEIVAADNAEGAGANTRALLVVHRGEIVAESYDQGADQETPLLGWSMAKSLTAILLGNLEYRGLLDLSEAPPFEDWAQDDRADIRLHHLLTMTDGLGFSEQYNPGDDSTTMLFTRPSASDYVMAMDVAHPPGTHFNYSSGTANLLARVHRDTLGGPQAAYDDYRTQIAGPLGFQQAVFETDADGTFVGSSYLYAPARDWARMGQLMLNEGELGGQRLLDKNWVRRATTPNASTNERAYGFQWWLNRGDAGLRFPGLPSDSFFASGNRQQFTFVFPSQDAVIVRLGWTSGRYPVEKNFAALLAALAK
jgi:hypothetical protein